MEAMNQLESALDWPAFVPFTDDYVGDLRLCLSCVAFLPPDLSEEISRSIISKLEQEAEPHYFYIADSLHVTVQSVRSISNPPNFNTANIAVVSEAFRERFEKSQPIELEINGLLHLPTSLALRVYSSEALLELTKGLRADLERVGVPDDKKYVNPEVVFGNVTICRYRFAPSKKFIAGADEIAGSYSAKFVVQEACLLTTNSVCHPSMTKIHKRFRLGVR